MKNIMGIGLVAACVMGISGSVSAGDVDVVKTRFELRSSSWYVSTTLKHGDTGWSHYADAWRVVNEKGEVLGERTLHHPHENEQPFTRSLGNIMIPRAVSIVYVEAHDKVHGWGKQRIRVDLNKSSGDRFEIRR